jgi:hypothetical protein
MRHRPGNTIKPVYDENVGFPAVGKGLLQNGPIRPRTGRDFLEDPFASSGPKSVHLTIKGLALGADAGVSDFHAVSILKSRRQHAGMTDSFQDTFLRKIGLGFSWVRGITVLMIRNHRY